MFALLRIGDWSANNEVAVNLAVLDSQFAIRFVTLSRAKFEAFEPPASASWAKSFPTNAA